MNETSITVVGNVTQDPELRFTASGIAVTNFSVASTPRVFDKASSQWKDGDTSFFRVTVWRDLAENVAEFVAKGKRVIVVGDIAQKTYQDSDGNTRYAMEVTGRGVGLDLTFLKPVKPEEETTEERPADKPKVKRQAPLAKG